MQIYAPKSFCLDIVIKSPKKKNIVFVAFLFSSFWILLVFTESFIMLSMAFSKAWNRVTEKELQLIFGREKTATTVYLLVLPASAVNSHQAYYCSHGLIYTNNSTK